MFFRIVAGTFQRFKCLLFLASGKHNSTNRDLDGTRQRDPAAVQRLRRPLEDHGRAAAVLHQPVQNHSARPHRLHSRWEMCLPHQPNPVPVEQNSRFAFCAPGSAAKEFFTKSKLPILELSHIWWVHSSGELLEDLRSSVLSDPLKPVFAGSCRTLTKMERWRWTSSAPPSTWWWPERTAMTFQRSFQRAWCQSWSTWTTQQVRRPQRFLTS